MNLQMPTSSPFHSGEQVLQSHVGKREDMEAFGRKVIRNFMPDQHREFYAQLPFIVVGSVSEDECPWATLLTGAPGFIQSPEPHLLHVKANARIGDPVVDSFAENKPLGMLGIEPSTRRRNRVNGRIAKLDNAGVTLRVDQAFGNCPQYIQARTVQWLDSNISQPTVQAFERLPADAHHLISKADTFFVASYVPQRDDPAKEGVDVSHRGGLPGFVRVDGNTITIPDFAGNNHFNTLGNFVVNPKAGLVFADFATGDLLQLTGAVELLDADHPDVAAFQGADRAWCVHVSQGQWLRQAMSLRFSEPQPSPNNALTDTWTDSAARQQAQRLHNKWRTFRLIRVEDESAQIRSFYLAPADRGALPTHRAGQHLPVRTANGEVRTYTLSSAPGAQHYRISVKREEHGTVSRHLHDAFGEGDLIEAQGPRGDFFIDPEQHRPALLIGGGVGITPMIAMASHLVDEGMRTRRMRPVTVFHASRTQSELAFATTFEQLSGDGVTYRTAVSNPTPNSALQPDFVGRLNADMLRASLALDDYDVYICGPSGFMQSVYRSLRELGIADERIFAETFGPSSLVRDHSAPNVDAATNALITFSASQFDQPWSDTDGTLLEFAEHHGLAPEFGCRGGSCGTCATRVLSGSAVNLKTQSVAKVGDKVLICCAAPAAGSDRLRLEL